MCTSEEVALHQLQFAGKMKVEQYAKIECLKEEATELQKMNWEDDRQKEKLVLAKTAIIPPIVPLSKTIQDMGKRF